VLMIPWWNEKGEEIQWFLDEITCDKKCWIHL
jgi:hypothetical protein